MSEVGVHLIVEGRVQGVGFRYFTQRAGISNNLKGSVRNLVDGNVEIVAEGEIQNINRFIDDIINDHPYAKVLNIKKSDLPFTGSFDGFIIKY
ncbi:MAG: acylphosphatase [Calditrichia bacterium]|nr:acylphosphatase [Calditrichia bacterium]